MAEVITWLKGTASSIYFSLFMRRMSSEEMGRGLAIISLKFLESIEQEQADGVAELTGDMLCNTQVQQMFHREHSALTFVSFRIAVEILGPEDRVQRRRVLKAFDETTIRSLNPQFLKLTDRRGPCYGKCIRENWGSEHFGARLSTLFDQFCLGGENAEDEPLIISDLFESFPRRAPAVAAVATVFETCKAVFDRTQLT